MIGSPGCIAAIAPPIIGGIVILIGYKSMPPNDVFWSVVLISLYVLGVGSLMFRAESTSSDTYTFDDNIDISNIEHVISEGKGGVQRIVFPTKGLAYKIARSAEGVYVQRCDPTTFKPLERPVLHGENSFRFGSNPDKSAAERIKSEVYHAPDRR